MEECGLDRKDAEYEASMPIECEVYYKKGSGVFIVESCAVESGTVYDPYDGEICGEDKS